jgi:hypothetical protein
LTLLLLLLLRGLSLQLLLFCSQLLLLVQCGMALADGLLVIHLPCAAQQSRRLCMLALLLLLFQQQCHVVLLVQGWRCITAEGHLAQPLQQRRRRGPLLAALLLLLLLRRRRCTTVYVLLLLLLLFLPILQLPC